MSVSAGVYATESNVMLRFQSLEAYIFLLNDHLQSIRRPRGCMPVQLGSVSKFVILKSCFFYNKINYICHPAHFSDHQLGDSGF